MCGSHIERKMTVYCETGAAISTNPKPTIYRNFYENMGSGLQNQLGMMLLAVWQGPLLACGVMIKMQLHV